MRTLALWTAFLLAAAAAPEARAADPSPPAPVEGVVLAVQDGEIIVDLGRAQGLRLDSPLQLYRRLVVKHPLTGKELQDRFPIGTVKPSEVGDRLTIVRGAGGLSRAPQPGDFVVYRPPAAPDAVRPAPVAARTTAPDADALEGILRQNMGSPLDARIQRFEGFLLRYPRSAFAPAVGTELEALRRLTAGGQPAVSQTPQADTLGVYFRKTRVGVAGQPFVPSVGLRQADQVQHVRLNVRRAGDPVYESFAMHRSGDGYFSRAFPAEFSAAAGATDYFVDAVTLDDAVIPLVAGADAPIRLRLQEAPVRTPQTTGRTRAEFRAEFVDFNTVGAAEDQYSQFEGSVRYAVQAGDVPLFRSFHVGAGSIDGHGGNTEEIDAGAPSERIALSYGFAEGEVELGSWFGVATRVLGGNHHATADGTARNVGGVEGRLRFGRWNGTRLIAGVSGIVDLGTQAFTQMHIETFPSVPIVTGVTVTDLPVAGSTGVRLTAQAGWRAADWLSLNLLTGWNARTIDHHGYSLGGSLGMEW